MLRTTSAAAAALVMCLVLAAWGSSTNDDSSAGTKPAGQASAPTPAGQAATPAATPKAAAKASKASESAKAAGSTSAKKTPTRGAAAVKAQAKADGNVSAAEANRRLRQLAKQAGAKESTELKAKIKKVRATTERKVAVTEAKLRKAAEAIKPTGKAGASGIVPAVKKLCTAGLEDSQGALKSRAAAQTLPGALSSTIAALQKASAKGSPYASGTTGDSVARVRTTEVVRAMKSALPAAKKYAASPTSANHDALSQALDNLSNNAYGNLLKSCAVS